jgi:ribonuclease-3
MDEGQLSRARASLVSAANLRTRAEHLALGRYLRIGSGEEKTGGREKPRLLAGALEAVIGAMYLDAGANLTRQVVVALLGDQLSEAGGAVAGALDFKSVLQERLQADGHAVPEYRVVGETGPDHLKTFRVRAVAGNAVLSDGEGPTRKAAEQAAARESLRMLDGGGDPPGSEAG